jgi:hypothetical protein
MRSHALDRRTVPLRFIRVRRALLVQKANDRGGAFTAALEQAEQLWRASDAVDLVASPILVFYGFAQAGRAICAAGVKDKNGWRPKEGHGLHFGLDPRPSGELMDLSAAWIEPSGEGLIQLVASVLDSPVLARRTTLAELISSLNWETYFEFEKCGYRRPLDASPVNMGAAGLTGICLLRVPPALVSKDENKWYADPAIEEVTKWLSNYPSVAALGTPAKAKLVDRLPSMTEVVTAIELGWEMPDAEADASHPLGKLVDISYGGEGGVFLPAVGGNTEAMHEVVLWWLILYGFSMLARYYPDAWLRVLDTDKSELAVPIDHLFSVARSELASMVFTVLNDMRQG